MWLHTSATNDKLCHYQVNEHAWWEEIFCLKFADIKQAKVHTCLLRKETKTNIVSDSEIYLSGVCQRKHYNILTVQMTVGELLKKMSETIFLS